MRAVVQRVDSAEVKVGNRSLASIQGGLLALVAVGVDDGPDDVAFIGRKLLNLRVFGDQEGKMNLSVRDVGGAVMLISQFTLYGDCRKGNRPSFSRSAPPATALALYRQLADWIEREGVRVETGRFQAMMKVALVNDGPVTLIVDSKKAFY
jgi:D-aminoacyl-tRNA deacylase